MGNSYSKLMQMEAVPYKRKPRQPRGRSRTPVDRKDPTARGAVKRRFAGGSRTRTQSRRRPLKGKISKTGENSSVSYTNYGKYSRVTKSIFNKLSGHNIRELLSSTSAISTQGAQKTALITLLERADLNLMKDDANAGVTTENDINLYLKTAKLRLHIKNQSNIMSKLLIYDIVTTSTGYTATIDDPVEAWDFGFNDMGTASQSTTVQTTPFGSPEFRKNFRITKVTRVPLEPGQEHEHVVKKHMNWNVRSTKWANTAAKNVRGLTYFTMLVWYGGLAHDTSAATSVTYAPVRLDYTIRKQYNYAFMNPNKPTYTLTDSIPKTIVDLDFMGENADQDLDPTNA